MLHVTMLCLFGAWVGWLILDAIRAWLPINSQPPMAIPMHKPRSVGAQPLYKQHPTMLDLARMIDSDLSNFSGYEVRYRK